MKRYFVLIILIMFVSFSFATKIGWIDSNRIMQELDEVREVEIELEKAQRMLQAEMENLISELDSLSRAFEKQKILMGPDRIAQKEGEIIAMRGKIEQFQLRKFGPQGEIYQLQSQLSAPIFAKVQVAIDAVGAERGYDLILDAVAGAIVYSLDAHNLTSIVIEELKKSSEPDTNSP